MACTQCSFSCPSKSPSEGRAPEKPGYQTFQLSGQGIFCVESPQFIPNSAHFSVCCPSQVPLVQSALGPPGLCPCWLPSLLKGTLCVESPGMPQFISTSATTPRHPLSVEHFRFSYTARGPSAQRPHRPPSPPTASASATLPRHLLLRAPWDTPTCAYFSFTCSAIMWLAHRTLGHPSLP